MATALESYKQGGTERSTLPFWGGKTLVLLLQLPKQTGRIYDEDVPATGYPAHILTGDNDYTVVTNNTFYTRDPFAYPIVADILEEERCRIPASLLHDALKEISSSGVSITVSGPAIFSRRTQAWGPIGYEYLNQDLPSEEEDEVTLTISLSGDMRNAALNIYRGKDKVEYAQIERSKRPPVPISAPK